MPRVLAGVRGGGVAQVSLPARIAALLRPGPETPKPPSLVRPLPLSPALRGQRLSCGRTSVAQSLGRGQAAPGESPV